jgi:hypothetical protein
MNKVHKLIKELAIYEKTEKELTDTVEQLISDGFGPTKVFDCIVAELENEVIGFALYYTSYSTWKSSCLYLEHFFLPKKYVEKG